MIKSLQFMLRCAYLYCWGDQGDAELRNTFNQSIKRLQKVFVLGKINYHGDGKTSWGNK